MLLYYVISRDVPSNLVVVSFTYSAVTTGLECFVCFPYPDFTKIEPDLGHFLYSLLKTVFQRECQTSTSL